jgi:hypothetical protein
VFSKKAIPLQKKGTHMEIENFERLQLCAEKTAHGVQVYVSASVEDGKLTLSGQDLGTMVDDTFGDSDYEYWYVFTEDNTNKLFELICKTDTPQAALKKNFSGIDGCKYLREFCEANGIEFGFSSYA